MSQQSPLALPRTRHQGSTLSCGHMPREVSLSIGLERLRIRRCLTGCKPRAYPVRNCSMTYTQCRYPERCRSGPVALLCALRVWAAWTLSGAMRRPPAATSDTWSVCWLDVERQHDELVELCGTEIVVAHDDQGLAPVGQCRAERHPFDVVDRNAEVIEGEDLFS
jgi:hypothetical protein